MTARRDPAPDPTAHPLWPVVVVLGEIAARLARERPGGHPPANGPDRASAEPGSRR